MQYEGVIPEHRAVREHAGIFDVSHMGQLEVRGPAALEFLQTMLSNDLSRIGMGQAQYTLLLDERGCPIDDLIAYRLDDDHLLLVVNAARGSTPTATGWPAGPATGRSSTIARPTWRCSRSRGRRPSIWWSCRSSRRSSSPAPRCAASSASSPARATRASRASRSWWPPTRPELLWDKLVAAGATPAGLGARDTLRLEVCYPLYGNDLSQSRTALEVGPRLGVRARPQGVRRRRRRSAPSASRAATTGSSRFGCRAAGIPRQGMAIRPAGEVTSGTMSPTLEVGIGMGYVPADLAAEGTEIEIDVRGRPVAARVAAKPLYVKEKVT